MIYNSELLRLEKQCLVYSYYITSQWRLEHHLVTKYGNVSVAEQLISC